MRAIGLTCGVGSMLIGAKQLGMEIMGMIEWRKYYHVGQPFQKHFNAPMWYKPDELTGKEVEMMTNADIAFGHP